MNQYDNPEFFTAYAQMSRSRFGLEGAGEWHQLEPLFPEMAGKAVLDLGCGYGWHCKYAADHGAASVLGIDQSERMISEAKKRNASERIAYRVCGIHDFSYPADTYDLVVSNLVLHYIEDLDAVYRLIHRTLKPGGTFLFNIEHPTFTAGVNQQFTPDGTWPVTDYYYPGPRTTDFLGHPVKKYHHTLTQILNGLLQTGFRIEAVEEAMPPAQWRSQMPEEMRRPMMLLVKAIKLVRERIPENIEASGCTCVTEILSDEEYLHMLDAKLDEELAEYHKDQNIEELADLLEVIYAAVIARGYTLEDLERVRAEKAAKRGAFAKKILLKEVIEK